MPRNKNNDPSVGGFGQPAQNVDATGRRIPDALPKRKPEEIIAPPAYRKDVFSGSRQEEWNDWITNTQNDPTLSSAGKKAFQDIFAAEGGMKKASTSTAFGGIVQSTLDGLKKQGFVNDIVAKHGQNVKTTDLDQHDLKEVYKGHFDDVFKGAADTAGIPGKGHTLLGTIGDDEIASVVADTLFRGSYKDTAEYIQRAVNNALPKNQHIATKGGPGTETLNGLRAVSKDPQRKRIFLDTLGDIRDQKFPDPSDIDRNNYFRFRK